MPGAGSLVCLAAAMAFVTLAAGHPVFSAFSWICPSVNPAFLALAQERASEKTITRQRRVTRFVDVEEFERERKARIAVIARRARGISAIRHV